jgi:exosortase sorting signal-containing protein
VCQLFETACTGKRTPANTPLWLSSNTHPSFRGVSLDTSNNATSTSSALTQSVIVIVQQPTRQIPTLSESMLALLAALIAMFAAARNVRRKG